MNTNKPQKQIVAWLLHHAAIRMLSDSPIKTDTRQRAQRLYGQLRAAESEVNLKGVDFIGKIIASLCGQLVRCEDTSQLEKVVEYIEGIEKGEIYIVADVEEPTLPTQNSTCETCQNCDECIGATGFVCGYHSHAIRPNDPACRDHMPPLT